MNLCEFHGKLPLVFRLHQQATKNQLVDNLASS